MIKTNDFKTKTFMKKHKMAGADKAWVIALDIGYSSVKTMSRCGFFSFPSFATRRLENPTLNIAEPSNDDIFYKDENGVIWVVGEQAVSSVRQQDNSNTEEMLYTRNRYKNPMFLVLARVGIALGLQNLDSSPNSDEPKGSNLVLQTGLPPIYLKSDSKILKKVLSGKHEFYLKVGAGGWKKYTFNLSENNIKIMGQPMGSLFSATFDDNGKEIEGATEFLHSNLLIFDGGFGTLDTFEIRNGAIGSMQTFDFLGMKAVLHEAADIIYKKYGEEIAVSAMQNNLKSGFISTYNDEEVSSEEVPIDGIIETASRNICMEAITQIRQIYNNLRDYKYLVITGGCGDAWFEMIKEYFSKMHGLEVIPANRNTKIAQIFSNVRGYYLYCVNSVNRASNNTNKV